MVRDNVIKRVLALFPEHAARAADIGAMMNKGVGRFLDALKVLDGYFDVEYDDNNLESFEARLERTLARR